MLNHSYESSLDTHTRTRTRTRTRTPTHSRVKANRPDINYCNDLLFNSLICLKLDPIIVILFSF